MSCQAVLARPRRHGARHGQAHESTHPIVDRIIYVNLFVGIIRNPNLGRLRRTWSLEGRRFCESWMAVTRVVCNSVGTHLTPRLHSTPWTIQQFNCYALYLFRSVAPIQLLRTVLIPQDMWCQAICHVLGVRTPTYLTGWAGTRFQRTVWRHQWTCG